MGGAVTNNDAKVHDERRDRFVLAGVANCDGTVLEANCGALQQSAVRGASLWQCPLWADDVERDRVRRSITEAARGKVVRLTTAVQLNGSARCPVDLQIVPMQRDSGESATLVFSAVEVDGDADIHEQPWLMDALRESEERLRLAAESAKFGTYDYDLERNEAFWSPALYAIAGASESDDISFEKIVERVHPDDRERYKTVIEAALDPAGAGEFESEHRIVLSAGAIRWVFVRGRTYFMGEGEERRPRRLTGIVLDITERRCSDEALRESEQRLQLLTDAMPALVSVLDSDFRYRFANQAYREWFGLGQEEILGRHVSEVLGDDVCARIVPRLERALAGETVEYEDALAYRHGGARYVLATYMPDRDESGRVRGVYVTVNDISARRAAEDALRKSEAEHRELADQLKLLLESTSHLIESLETEQLLPSLLGLARKLVAADAYGLWRVDQCGYWSVVSSHGLSSDFLEESIHNSENSGIPITPLVIQPSDLARRSDPLLRNRWERYRRDGIQSLMILPLKIHGEVSGTLVFYSRTPHVFTTTEVEAAQTLANLAAAAITTSELYSSESRLRRQAEESAVRERFLADSGAILAEPLDLEVTLANVARAAVPDFAEWCAVDLLDANGVLRRLSVAHVDPEKVALAHDLHEKYPPEMWRDEGLVKVIRTGEAEMANEVPDELLVRSARDEDHLQILRELQLSSYICVPLRWGEAVRGAISFVGESGRRFEDADRSVALEIARRAAQAIDNARLYGTLRQSEERYRAVVESQSEMVCRFRPDGTILFVNGAYARAQGTTPEGLQGANLWDLIDEEYRGGVRELLDTLTPESPEVRIENRFETVGGSRWTLWTNRALEFDASGGAVELQSTGIDITDRKRAELALRESEERFRDLADNIAQLAWMTDDTGWIFWYNKRWFDYTGTTLEEMAGWGWTKVHHPDHVDRVVEKFSECIQAGQVWEDTFPLRGRDGEYRWFLSRAVPIRDPDGRVIRWFGTNTDITARKATEEALQQARDELETRVAARTRELKHRAEQLARLTSELSLAEQRERQRLARVLHDHLQQLLVGAKIRLDVLARSMNGNFDRGISGVSELIDEAIAASRSLTMELAPPILHEAGLVAGFEWLARFKRQKYGLEVKLTADERAEPEREDVRTLLFQSARELLFNVVKHSGAREAAVDLSLLNEDEIVVTVSDSGKGFDPSMALTADSGDETGFGLFSISERLTLLGGRFEVESTPGKGSRFSMVAPRRSATMRSRRRATDAALPEPAALLERSSLPRSGLVRVLLVDDHRVMREGLRSLLASDAALQVVGEASDGAQAIEQAHVLQPDVILMDFSMPDMDGVEATRRIKAELPQINVIGLSMYEEPDRAAAMLGAGASGYHTKSGKTNALLQTIRDVVAASAEPAEDSL